ncbi:MAG: primosome assembly protein PriA, partial [Pseudonocardiaceae bacterium]
ACGQCRAPARCRRCAGPLALPAHGGEAVSPACRWCGATEGGYRCPVCGSQRLRAVVIGAHRTAEELGRAFPGTPVHTSGDGKVLDGAPSAAALVISTPGAEPAGRYGAALLLDAWALLARPDLRAGEEALRRWMVAAAMVRPASDGGRVVVVADAALRPVQALVRWDPAGHAAAELADRRELSFPPVVRMAAVDGPPATLAGFADSLELPADAELLGPVPLPGRQDGERERLLVRVPRQDGAALATALSAAQAVRTARKEPDALRVQLDPTEVI